MRTRTRAAAFGVACLAGTMMMTSLAFSDEGMWLFNHPPKQLLKEHYQFEFPDGWRTYEGIRWSRFPDGIADERTKREVMLVSNIVARVGLPLHAADDPAFAALGNTLVRFLQQRDEKIFASEAMRSFEETWEALMKKP